MELSVDIAVYCWLALYQAGFFELLKGMGDYLTRVRETAVKAVYFTQITWNLEQHIFGL